MLGDAVAAAQLATAAPVAALGALALIAAAWVYRQCRRDLRAAREEAAGSAARQGKRLGDLERAAGLLDLRRRQVEAELTGLGVDLPYWPPDGQPAPLPRPRRVDDASCDQSTAETRYGLLEQESSDYLDQLADEVRRIPVPPLDPAVTSRHRRA